MHSKLVLIKHRNIFKLIQTSDHDTPKDFQKVAAILQNVFAVGIHVFLLNLFISLFCGRKIHYNTSAFMFYITEEYLHRSMIALFILVTISLPVVL